MRPCFLFFGHSPQEMNHGGGRRPRSAQERGALIAMIEVFRPVVE